MKEPVPFEFDATWTPERVEVVRKAICPAGIPDADFWLFMLQVQRTGLDPLQKECFCVKRRQNIGTRQNEKWIDKYEFQAAAQGMVSRAESMPDFRGISWSAVYDSENCRISKPLGTVQHEFNAAKRAGALSGAYCIVRREGRPVDVVEWVDFAAVVQPGSSFWSKDPAGMTEKCAIARGLRRAYPRMFTGVYIRGERQDDVESEDAPPPVEASAHPIPRVVRPELPQETATRQSAPVLEFSKAAPEPVPVEASQQAAAVSKEMGLEVESILAEATAVAAEAAEEGKTEKALARAHESLTALGSRARKLPKDSPGRQQVGAKLEELRALLFTSAKS